MLKILKNKILSGAFIMTLAVFSFVFSSNNAMAASGEGTATVNGAANATVITATSNTYTVVLTVGATGITTGADSPTFTIPTGFTAPAGTPAANVGAVTADGMWFATAAGGTCTAVGTTATGQVITVSVTGNCATTNTITLTYKGTSSTVGAATPIVITTDDALAGTPAAPIATPPTITVAAVPASPAAVNLLTSGDYAVFSDAAITNTGTSVITGDIGVGPGVTSTAITGFALTTPSQFSTSAQVTGNVYAHDYAVPTPTKVNTASLDLGTAYTDATSRATSVLNIGGGHLGGLTLVPGVYTFGTNVDIASALHLSGNASDVWIFQISGNLNLSSATSVLLSGGAVPSNIFWAVAGTTTLQANSTFEGNIISGPATATIAMQSGAILHGRALGQKDVTLIGNTIVNPGPVVVSNPTPTPNPNPSPFGGNIGRTDGGSRAGAARVFGFPAFGTPPSSCAPGAMFDATNGQSCASMMNPVSCPPGQMFRATDGARCTSAENLVFCPPGQMFNATNGARCNTTIDVSAPGASGYNFGNTTLKNGSRGNGVMELQKFLNKFENTGLVLDGKLGPKTIAIIKKWQAARSLAADGVVGPKTMSAMNSWASTH